MDRFDESTAAGTATLRGEPRAGPVAGRRSGRQRVLRALAAVALALGVYAVLGYLVLPSAAHDALVRRLSAELDRPVSIGRLHIDPFLLQLRIDDLSVKGATDGIEVAGFEELAADFSSGSLWHRAPVLSSLRIEQPRMRLQRDASGRYAIQDLLDKWTEPANRRRQSAAPVRSVAPDARAARTARGQPGTAGEQAALDEQAAPGGQAAPDGQAAPEGQAAPDGQAAPEGEAGRSAHPPPSLQAARAGQREPDSAPRFSVANIVVNGGRLTFEDAHRGVRHEVTALALRVPLVSSFPADQALHVEPHLSASVDGVPVALDLRALPFDTPGQWEADLVLQPIELARFVAYLPGPPAVDVRSGRFGAQLHIVIGDGRDASSIRVRGRSSVSNLVLADPAGGHLFSAESLDFEAIELRWPEGRHSVGRVALTRGQLTARRRAAETRFFEPVLARLERGASGGIAPGADWHVDELVITDGRVSLLDERFEPKPLHLRASRVDVKLLSLGTQAGDSGTFEASLSLADGETLHSSGTADWHGGVVDASVRLSELGLRHWWWAIEPRLGLSGKLEAMGGTAGIGARIRVAAAADGAATVRLEDGSLRLRELWLRQRWDGRTLANLPQIDLDDVALDPGRRTVEIGSLGVRGGRLLLRRETGSRMNWQRIVALSGESAGQDESSAAPAPKDAVSPWSFALAKLAIDGLGVDVEDEAAGRTASMRVQSIALDASGLSNRAGDPPGRIAVRAFVDRQGTLELAGRVSPRPFGMTLQVAGTGLPLLALQPYFTDHFPAIVSSGTSAFDGELEVTSAPEGDPRIEYRGAASIEDFAVVTRAGNRDLLRWKSLAADTIDFRSEPLRIDVGEVAVSALRSRLIINREGRFNVQDLLVDRKAQRGSSSVPAPSDESRPSVRIGAIRISDGSVDFSDFFVRPTYSVNLTGLSGVISGIDDDGPGEVELRGRIDQTASVEIRGQVDPLAETLFVDLHADARDIDLPRLSPYARKYVGHGIEKGKLSARLHYRIADRQLTADNELVLDQLTFGEKAETDEANSLPVTFAIALLKDRNGVVDVSVPIAGSLDDPQFSIGGIVMRLIGGLVTKAISSPFALLANVAGATAAELSWLDFDPGSASMPPATQTRLQWIAKALADRPALRLDLAGRADRTVDGERLREMVIERRVREQKRLDAIRAGESVGPIESVQLEADEYRTHLERVWRDAGFPKTAGKRTGGARAEGAPGVEAMRADLLGVVAVSDSALIALASRRAQAAKAWLVDHGGINPARLFVTAAKVDSEGAGVSSTASGAQAAASSSEVAAAPTGPRVELSLR